MGHGCFSLTDLCYQDFGVLLAMAPAKAEALAALLLEYDDFLVLRVTEHFRPDRCTFHRRVSDFHGFFIRHQENAVERHFSTDGLAEARDKEFLCRADLHLVARNFHDSKHGEKT